MARTSLKAWCIEAQSDEEFFPAKHHQLLIDELNLVASGDVTRLMVLMPPGHAKTRYASILFPAWFFAQNPKLKSGKHRGRYVIGASHASDYAEDLSGQILKYVVEHRRTLGYRNINDNKKLWRTDNAGVYRAAGAGGSITGRRADLFVIDDPIKSREEADSIVIRDKIWNWYRGDVISRIKAGGRIVLIQTRWHEDDLAGRLLEEMKLGGRQWRILDLAAIWEERKNTLGTEPDVDPLGRVVGEALWPEEYDVGTLLEKKQEAGPREWASLFQQRPRPNEGSLFKKAFIQVYDVSPVCNQIVRSWDLGATSLMGSRDPDYTVGLKLGRTDQGRYVVLDLIRERLDPAGVLAMIKNTADQDGRNVHIRIPQDPGAGGKTTAAFYVGELAGYTVHVQLETNSKAVRATPVASQVNIGNTGIVRAKWNEAFLDELVSFPSTTHDDQVDAYSGGFNYLATLVPKKMTISKDALRRAAQR